MEIRKFSKEYIGKAALIEKACFSVAWDEAALAAELENPCSHLYIAFADGKAAGYAAIYAVEGEADIARVAVLPEYRRRGIAEAMLLYALKDVGASTAFLDVRESNLPAVKLYEKLGFKSMGVRKNYYSDPAENAVLMKLDARGK